MKNIPVSDDQTVAIKKSELIVKFKIGDKRYFNKFNFDNQTNL